MHSNFNYRNRCTIMYVFNSEEMPKFGLKFVDEYLNIRKMSNLLWLKSYVMCNTNIVVSETADKTVLGSS